MRRGHQSIGGWHNDNPRHLRTRNGGNPHFRSPKNSSSFNSNRFPPSDTRYRRPNLKTRTGSDEFLDQEYHERHRYRPDSQFSFSRFKDKTPYKNDRHISSSIQHTKHGGSHSNYKGSHNSEVYSINSMGDIDQRQIHINEVHPIPPWNIDNQLHDIDDRTYNKTYRDCTVDLNKSHPDYAGHRPPASDHYGGNPIPTNENSKTFSRSVDDTVNIVRKRLLSRGDAHQAPDTNDVRENTMEQNVMATPSSSQYEQLIKRKTPKPNKVNCDKIKNKIFHQLFKMDKEKIHKLLDNPSSSNKFEYAINSLLTESQNSFNQHLRSVAEKSLCTSSKDFMQNDNNTIYEDTFMKQMQCILDPQDTVLLEDIKPVVMAELSNLLQFDDVDSRCYTNDNQHNFSHYQDSSTAEQYSQDFREQPAHSYDSGHNPENFDNVYFENLTHDYPNFGQYEAPVNSNRRSFEESSPLFERRQRRKSCTFTPDINTASGRLNHLNRVDSKFIEKYSKDSYMPGDNNKPLFDANADFTEDEDIFAELDKQYHVAVDHDFIEYDDLSNPIKDSNDNAQPQKTLDIPKALGTVEMKQDIDFPKTPIKVEQLVKEEIDCQLQDIASVELDSFISFKNESECKNNKESTNSQHVTSSLKTAASQQSLSSETEIQNKSNDSINSEDSAAFKINPSFNSRKRSIDQRPSHRKEKRKKSQEKDDSGKNRHINDCMSKEFTEPKQNKEQNSNSEKKSSSSEKIYSEKYVKRKNPPKKFNSNEDRKRQNSTSSSHSTSPKNNNTFINQPASKSDSKNSLKTIDMFTEVPKKINIHQACRNTALNVTPKKIAEIKPKPVFSLNQKHQKKHDVGTQVIKRIHSKETQTLDSRSSTSRFCQTDKKKLASKAIQTDIQPDKHIGSTKSTDAFERMKEIDLEIQALLQEKFKLYNSMESKEGTIPMHNLGMTVLNVSSFDDNKEENETLEDTIVNNFTNIPEHELEQIAFETDDAPDQPLASRRNRRRKNSYSSIHSGSTSSYTRRNKKSQTPNISLIEQIITDDRPLEDIISLDDLEVTPATSKRKQKPKKRMVSKKKDKTMGTSDQIVLRECYVLLLREDLSKYYTSERTRNIEVKNNDANIMSSIPVEEFYEVIETDEILNEGDTNHCENVIEETVVSDLQFDMLDVSEDIVIGEDYEDKSTGEKEVIEHLEVPISEEIILDNSQSSIEEATIQSEPQGGECKLYDYLSDENLQRDSLVVSGNADAVLAIECVGQNFLAAGLDGNVYYFSSDGQIITTLRGSNLAVTCLCIVKEKFGTTVYTGSLDSRIRNYDLETGLEKGPECNVLSPIQTMDRAWDTVFVGTRTGFVLQFECKNNMLIPVSTVKFSDQSILALRAMKEGPRKVLLVAARSENVTIKDAQTGLLLRTLSGPKMTVYTLLFEDGKVYCGTSSHQIQVFDYTSGSHVGTHEGGKGAVCLRAAGGLLFAGCYDGCVYVYREGEPRPFAQLRGPSLMLLCLAVVGTKIIVGFKDRSLYIWKIPLCILQEMIL